MPRNPKNPYVGLSAQALRELLEKRDLERAAEVRETEFYRMLLEAQGAASLDGILVTGPRGKILSYNPRFRIIWGLSEAVLASKVKSEAVQAVLEKLQHPAAFLAKVHFLDSHPEVSDHSELLLKDGTILDRYSAPIRGPDGVIHGRVWHFRDATEKKRHVHLLLEQRNHLALAMEVAEIGSWNLNLVTNALTFSRSLKEILGVSADQEVSFDQFIAMVHTDDRDRIYARVRAAGNAKTTGETRYRVVRSDGTIRWLQSKSRNFFDREGKVIELMGVAKDITREIAAEALVEEQNAKMLVSSKLSALGEMAGGVAHEINNPLAVIHSMAGQLKDLSEAGVLDHAAVARTADNIETTALRIAKIVRSLRAFARDGDRQPIERVSIRNLIEDCLLLCRARFFNHGIQLEFDAEMKEALIECRPMELSQVVINLLNNAHDAVESLSEKWIRVSLREVGEHFEIAVTDSGHGIPVAIREKIMHPFFTTKEVGKGTGVGLSVSKGILETHAGTLELDTENEHTCFVMRLPKTHVRKAA